MAWDPIRQWIHRRPVLLLAACLALGAVIGWQNAVPWWCWGIVLVSSAALGLLSRKSVFIFSSALPLGALLIALALLKPTIMPQDDVVLTGRLASEPDIREEYVRFLLDDVSADGEALPIRVMLYLYGKEYPFLEYGATISVHADTYLPTDRENPYADSYAAYLWQQGVALCASGSFKDLSVLAPPSFSLTGFSIRCRLYLQSVVERTYSEDIAPLVTSLLLGDRSMLPNDLYSAFKTAGLAHLLAISGLHIACLAAALDVLLRRLRCPAKVTLILVSLFLLAYSSVIGFPPSVNRALLMYVLSAGARLFGRPSDGLTGLSLSFILLMLLNPLNITNVSFVLSFSSVAGILIFSRLLTPRCIFRIRGPLHKPVSWLIAALAVSLAAQLGALPAIAVVFGSLSTYALLANLPALPLMTASLPVAIVSVGLGCVHSGLGQLIALPVEGLLRALIYVTNRVAALPGAVVNTPAWPPLLLLLYALICVLCSPVSHIRRHFKQFFVGLLPACAVSALFLPAALPTVGLEAFFLDAGQADAALIRAEDRFYLMDVGEDSTMADYLRASGIRPDAIFLSHPHADHAGGLTDVIGLCKPAVIYVPCLWDEVEADDGVPDALAAAREAGWIVQPLMAGDTLSLSENVSARVYQPLPDMTADANGASLILSVHLGDSSILFTGDLPAENELAMFPDCDVLKVAHHGAKESTSGLFLKMTSPTAAVISVGHNSYGHPAPETIARLEASGASIYRTDECGAISALLGVDGIIRITPLKTAIESEAAS